MQYSHMYSTSSGREQCISYQQRGQWPPQLCSHCDDRLSELVSWLYHSECKTLGSAEKQLDSANSEPMQGHQNDCHSEHSHHTGSWREKERERGGVGKIGRGRKREGRERARSSYFLLYKNNHALQDTVSLKNFFNAFQDAISLNVQSIFYVIIYRMPSRSMKVARLNVQSVFSDWAEISYQWM